jgi:hypothetical protein
LGFTVGVGAALLAAADELVEVLVADEVTELLRAVVAALVDDGALVPVAVPVLTTLDAELVAAVAAVEMADAVEAAAGWDDVETVAVAPQAESATAARSSALAVSAVRRDSRCGDHRGEGMRTSLIATRKMAGVAAARGSVAGRPPLDTRHCTLYAAICQQVAGRGWTGRGNDRPL